MALKDFLDDISHIATATPATVATHRQLSRSTVAEVATLAVADPRSASIDELIHAACIGLSITPEQLKVALEQGGDIPDLISGELSVEGLRLAAETLSNFI